MGELFVRALDLWRPDMVHFHATQRLTASPLEVCRERGVPYAVTLHDAWWIADHQFLIDDQGQPVDPTDPLSARPPKGIGLGESLERRRRLTELLNGAEAVWAVSERFAQLHRDCGVVGVTALSNGVHPAAGRPRSSSASGRVRLAHVGGRTLHKGDHLIQAALRQGRFANLELTVVDHDRTGGEVRHQTWGATPVRIVGRTPQEQMAEVYAAHDVLLAPSIWPESYGLVAREALAEGLWVVAGNRGAIGEDVREAVNGFVVDVSTPQGLFEALARIDADPARYRTSPPPTALRSAKAQSTELGQLYRRILSRRD
jgi:glycosyltransferase involved in cell wall biosynthesis